MSTHRVTLLDLPQFSVLATRQTSNNSQEAEGIFSQLPNVAPGEWGWLYVPSGASIIGTVLSLDPITRRARFNSTEPNERLQAGATFPFLHRGWNAEDLDIALGPTEIWNRVKFVPRDSVRYRDSRAPDSIAEQLAERPLPPTADKANVCAGGWDHENCQFCQAEIGPTAQPFAYSDSQDRWLCERCYKNFVVPHSLGFVLDIWD